MVRLGENKSFTFYSILAIAIIAAALILPLILSASPYDADMTNPLAAPSFKHLAGTDKLGRDLMIRIIHGAKYSLYMTFVLTISVTIIGTAIGIISGMCGGIIDGILMRLADIMISFPGIVLAIAISGMLGPNMTNAIIAIAAVSWTKYARLSRSLVLKMKTSTYMEASVILGSSPLTRVRKYILPEIAPTMIIAAATDLGSLLMEVAGLSFLGFGAQAPIPEWGTMLNEGRYYLTTAPWLCIYPGLAIVIVVSIFNLWGDSLRDVLDPDYKEKFIKEELQ